MRGGHNRKGILGNSYNMLTVIREHGRTSKGEVTWYCECECGGHVIDRGGRIVSGARKSCGCIKGHNFKTHGLKSTYPSEYAIWKGIRQRCNDENCENHKSYGARGIRRSDEWDDFETFINDMGPRPSKHHSIERKDNDGDYCKDNCIWATRMEQAANKSTNRRVEYMGKMIHVAELSRIAGVSSDTICARLNRGLNIEESVNKEDLRKFNGRKPRLV